jgi:hypothetical protein
LLRATPLDGLKVAPLRDGTEALVGGLAMVVGGFDEAPEHPKRRLAPRGPSSLRTTLI